MLNHLDLINMTFGNIFKNVLKLADFQLGENTLNIQIGYADHIVKNVGVLIHFWHNSYKQVKSKELVYLLLNGLKQDFVEKLDLLVGAPEYSLSLLCLEVL